MVSEIIISEDYRETLAVIGLDRPERVFGDSRLRVWRDLEDRDNSTLDATLADGRAIRLHVKRDKRQRHEPMALEARGIQLLNRAGIESAPLVAHGTFGERTFVITENLDGYTSADRLIEIGLPREPIFKAMIEVAARLHRIGLHHRDLYANHFYLKPVDDGYAVRLIDAARVRRSAETWFAARWVVKDVAQLLFSISGYMTSPDDWKRLLRMYEDAADRRHKPSFERWVFRKADWIMRHDQALRAKKPKRNLRLADGN